MDRMKSAVNKQQNEIFPQMLYWNINDLKEN